MTYLLDTHIFLWAVMTPERLTAKARDIIEDYRNEVCVSAVTFWEISLKFSIGKLELNGYSPEKFPALAKKMKITSIPLTPELTASFHSLPKSEHKDPFDRMLVWQAIQSDMILLSRDGIMSDYQKHGLKVLRA